MGQIKIGIQYADGNRLTKAALSLTVGTLIIPAIMVKMAKSSGGAADKGVEGWGI